MVGSTVSSPMSVHLPPVHSILKDLFAIETFNMLVYCSRRKQPYCLLQTSALVIQNDQNEFEMIQ